MTSSPTPRRFYAYLGCLVIAVGAAGAGAGAGACAHSTNSDFGEGGTTGSTGSDGNIPHLGDSGTPPAIGPSTCTMSSPCTDFSATPVIGPGATSAAAATFGAAGTGGAGGPCLVEPQDGTLFPNGGDGTGWLTPRVSFGASAGQDLFEIRFSSPVEKNDLVVYTSNTWWTFDLPTWKTISKNLVGPTITVTVRAAAGTTITKGGSAGFTIASLPASGALIYWTTASHDNSATSTSLNGFHVGDTGNATVLVSSQVTQTVVATPVSGANTTSTPVADFCIGCHTATPDGLYVAFNAQWPWPAALASPAPATVGTSPSWLSAGALLNMNPLSGPASGTTTWYDPPQINQVMLGIQTFSGGDGMTTFGHYKTGDRIVITTLGASENATSLDAATTATGVIPQLAWINLEYAGTVSKTAGLPMAPCVSPDPAGTCLPAQTPNGGWGIIARNGDTGTAGAPSWSHNLDGKTDVIAYTETPAGILAGVKDGRMNDGPADIYTVPYTSNGPGLGGAGGAAAPLSGASTSANNEYYPAWSPDDALIAFNSVATGNLMYAQPLAEVNVVPYNKGAGGTAVRLAANDPVACAGGTSPGVQNTWPRWAPLPYIPSATMAGNQGTDGKLYYWVTFSSTRPTGCTVAGGNLCTASQASTATGRAQLYVAGIVVDPANNNAITTTPAIYLWNQDFTFDNLIPAWDNFQLPPGTGTQPPK